MSFSFLFFLKPCKLKPSHLYMIAITEIHYVIVQIHLAQTTCVCEMGCKSFHGEKYYPINNHVLVGLFPKRRGTPGCGPRSRVSTPGRPQRFPKPIQVQAPMGKPTVSMGHLAKGASWEELIQACLQAFGKLELAFIDMF